MNSKLASTFRQAVQSLTSADSALMPGAFEVQDEDRDIDASARTIRLARDFSDEIVFSQDIHLALNEDGTWSAGISQANANGDELDVGGLSTSLTGFKDLSDLLIEADDLAGQLAEKAYELNEPADCYAD